jgi:hypothetical protein
MSCLRLFREPFPAFGAVFEDFRAGFLEPLLVRTPNTTAEGDPRSIDAYHIERILFAAAALRQGRSRTGHQGVVSGDPVALGDMSPVAHMQVSRQKEIDPAPRQGSHPQSGTADQIALAVAWRQIEGMVGGQYLDESGIGEAEPGADGQQLRPVDSSVLDGQRTRGIEAEAISSSR